MILRKILKQRLYRKVYIYNQKNDYKIHHARAVLSYYGWVDKVNTCKLLDELFFISKARVSSRCRIGCFDRRYYHKLSSSSLAKVFDSNWLTMFLFEYVVLTWVVTYGILYLLINLIVCEAVMKVDINELRKRKIRAQELHDKNTARFKNRSFASSFNNLSSLSSGNSGKNFWPVKKKITDLKIWKIKMNMPITANIAKATRKNGSPMTYNIPLPNIFNKLIILILF